jgi:hypothetical protein
MGSSLRLEGEPGRNGEAWGYSDDALAKRHREIDRPIVEKRTWSPRRQPSLGGLPEGCAMFPTRSTIPANRRETVDTRGPLRSRTTEPASPVQAA